MRILFVENHATFAKSVVQQFLGGHDVIICPSLVAAREALRSGSFDAALVDFDLDDGKGDVLVRELVETRFPGKTIGVLAHEAGNRRR